MPRYDVLEGNPRTPLVGMVTAFLLWLSLGLCRAQIFTVLHSFTGLSDGANPLAGVIMDGAGNLYGTASVGGRAQGAVYELAHRQQEWMVNPLYQFNGAADGFYPEAGVTMAPDGTLHGTNLYGGSLTKAVIRLGHRPAAQYFI